MLSAGLINELNQTEAFFMTTISPLSEADGSFRPHDDMYTVTGHIHHSATSITWFIDGAFRRDDGFAMNFEDHIADSQAASDFDACVALLTAAFSDARTVIGAQSDAQLMSPLPAGPIMGGAPRLAVVGGITDHTAHHRGALSVYCRLLQKVPPMPYAAAE